MEVQERIVQKAHELFMRYGIRSVSMDDLATNLGISKKTIYQYYADKDALVDAVIELEIQVNEMECSRFKLQSNNAIHEVILAMNNMQEMLKGMNPYILFDLERFHPKTYQKFTEHTNGFFYGVVKENFERGIREELYRSEINVELITRYRLATIFLIFRPDAFPGYKGTMADLLMEITDHFLWGITTSKGQKLLQKLITKPIK
jgi:TetR/AcrR family transcriptional regulator, cholesterol catabolism regulator